MPFLVSCGKKTFAREKKHTDIFIDYKEIKIYLNVRK